ncbi:MAG: N-acetylmuramoyl-L-alanine amidase [Bacillota bacterium]
MRQILLTDLCEMANDAKPDLQQAAAQMGRPVKIYAHWTAGHYGQFFDDYHISIDQDGGVYTAVDDLSTQLAHTYRRNSGAVGLAVCCAYGAVSADNLGPEPPTDMQIEALSQVIAVLTSALAIPIDIQHVMTHAEAADNLDGDDRWHTPYGPDSTVERWDLWVLKEGDPAGSGGGIMRGKAVWYQNNGGL